MSVPLLGPPAIRASLPCPPPDCGPIFEEALRATALCADAATACGSAGARTYAAGAAGALRNALEILGKEGRVGACVRGDDFDVRQAGSSELVGGRLGWDTVKHCRLPDGGTGTARALWPRTDVTRATWLRSVDTRGFAVRGRVEENGEWMEFVDHPTLDLPPAPPVRHELGRDLVRAGLGDLSRTPALASALEIALVTGSWLHLASGSRWFTDRAGARAIARMLGSPVTVDDNAHRRLAGLIDRGALLLIERLGWRHLPTPRF